MKTKAKLWYNKCKYYSDKLNALFPIVKKATYVNIFKKTIMTLKKHGKKKMNFYIT